MNCCGYDYVTLGNHDFNYGMAYLDSYLDALEAPSATTVLREINALPESGA